MAERKLTLLQAHDGTLTVVHSASLEIGRDFSCDLCLGEDPEASLLHARIVRDEQGVYRIHDLESDNGTWVNGVRVDLPVPVVLNEGDEIRIGSTRITVGFRESAPAAGAGAPDGARSPPRQASRLRSPANLPRKSVPRPPGVVLWEAHLRACGLRFRAQMTDRASARSETRSWSVPQRSDWYFSVY